MKIIDIMRQDRPTLSFEVFPPKTSASYQSVERATREIAALRPAFMSVTYGAGGGTSDYTVGIAADIREKFGVEVLAHLTCLSSTRDHVASPSKGTRAWPRRVSSASMAWVSNWLTLQPRVYMAVRMAYPFPPAPKRKISGGGGDHP